MGDRRGAWITLLIDDYGFPLNGAAGIVGNLDAESGLLPNRVEGSDWRTPMRSLVFGPDNAKHEPTAGAPAEAEDL